MLALERSDLDESTSEINISKSLEQTKAGLRIKSTKPEELRHYSVPEWALEVLCEHREDQDGDRQFFGTDYEEHDLVFWQPNGAFYSPGRLGARVSELMRKAGLRGVRLHALRNSHASSLLSNGVPNRGRFRTPGARGPEHHPVDLLLRATGRHEGCGEDLERRHSGHYFGRPKFGGPKAWRGADVRNCLHAEG